MGAIITISTEQHQTKKKERIMTNMTNMTNMTTSEFLTFFDGFLFCKEGAPSPATPEEVVEDWKLYCEYTDDSPIKSLGEYVETLELVSP